MLPDDDVQPTSRNEADDDSAFFSASDTQDAQDDGWDEDEDISAPWSDVHEAIKDTIAELGGKVVPKLNWSAPKDATWINANTMECRTPGDIYLLLKSSDFITHDLEHAFDETISEQDDKTTAESIPYQLVLRKAFDMNPSVEFRCFVRNRRLLAICQRDMNHFDFLANMQDHLRIKIQEFFDVRLRDTFSDENFVFDVYVPNPYDRVWLVDINPWAPRTDPLLFSWMELLTMPEPPSEPDMAEALEGGFVRLHFSNGATNGMATAHPSNGAALPSNTAEDVEDSESDDSDADEELWQPEFRLVRRNDPEAYSFNTPQYSAHKLPKDVVDASQSGEGLREFAREWESVLAKRQAEDAAVEESEAD